MKLTRPTAVILLASMTACFTQRPLATPIPAPTTRVVATLTDAGTVAMSNAIGAGATLVEGIVASADDNSWNLQLVRVEHRDGRSIPWNRELVTFPRVALTQPTERILDKKKSWVAAGMVVAGALIVATAFRLVGGDTFSGQEPIPPAMTGRGK